MMTTTPEEGDSMSLDNDRHDDLTKIKNIGEKWQQWLQDQFQIHTFEELAQLSIEKIVARCKEEGRIYARDDIELWIAQAQTLADPSGMNPGEANDHQVNVQDEPVAKEHRDWDAFARFTVEFQKWGQNDGIQHRTMAYRTKTTNGGIIVKQEWPGIEQEQLCRWMADQITPETSTITSPEKTRAMFDIEGAMRITQLRIMQPAVSTMPVAVGENKNPLHGEIRSETPLTIVAILGFDPEGASEFDFGYLKYRIEYRIYNLDTQYETYLDDNRQLSSNNGSEQWHIPINPFVLDAGRYRLVLLFTLESSPPKIDYFEVPLFQVL